MLANNQFIENVRHRRDALTVAARGALTALLRSPRRLAPAACVR